MFSRLTEQQLFNYWRLIYWFNLGKEKQKGKILLGFRDLYTEINQSVGSSVYNVIWLFNHLNINFKNIQFSEKEFLFWSKNKKPIIEEFLKENSKTEIGKSVKIIFHNNNISEKDLETIIISKKDINLLLNYIYFEVNTGDILKIKNFLNQYIQNFIDNNLVMEKQNFYDFNNQNKRMEALFRKNSEFGKNFIIRYDPEHPFLGEKSFLFVHTLIALELLGYLKIEELYTFYWGEDPKKHTKDYKAKILLGDKFFSEDKLEDIDEFSEKPKFNKDRLFFNDKEFDFKNSPNQCDLLNTLFKDVNKSWYYDEIQEDWDSECYAEALREHNYWRKFYGSADEINKKIAIETGEKEFLIKTTKKIMINPKYL